MATKSAARRRQQQAPYPPPDTGRRRPGPRFFVLGALILAVSGGITALTVSKPAKVAITADPTSRPLSSFAGAPETAVPVTPTTPQNAPISPQITPTTPTQITPDGEQPRPWQYDPVNDRHWVPTEGHKHWHSGPPPEPWEYNEQKDEHFDPSPGHQHWHPGPPPPPEQRQP